MFEGKKILITGGTGSLGRALTERLLKSNVDRIRIFSRNESKQVDMESKFTDKRLRFLIGDIRDRNRLIKALEDIDIVFHAAALKHIDVVEYNPSEAIQTNVVGSQNVIDASLIQNVQTVVGISTDKAVSPLNTYGATKLLMEKFFVSANHHINPKKHRTKFYTLRYGNVIGSSGSVIPKFINQIKNNGKITITDPSMTRFSITFDETYDFIVDTLKKAKGGEVFVPKLRSFRVDMLKDVLFDMVDKAKIEKIPIRPGEKFHEVLINDDEVRYTLESKKDYMLVVPHPKLTRFPKTFKGYSKTTLNSQYSSDKVKLLSKQELKKIINDNGLLSS